MIWPWCVLIIILTLKGYSGPLWQVRIYTNCFIIFCLSWNPMFVDNLTQRHINWEFVPTRLFFMFFYSWVYSWNEWINHGMSYFIHIPCCFVPESDGDQIWWQVWSKGEYNNSKCKIVFAFNTSAEVFSHNHTQYIHTFILICLRSGWVWKSQLIYISRYTHVLSPTNVGYMNCWWFLRA